MTTLTFFHAIYHCYIIFRVMSFSNIYTINAWLLLAPSSLCCDWSLGSVPLVTSFADIRNVWSIVLYTGLLTLVVHALRPKRYIISLIPRPTSFFVLRFALSIIHGDGGVWKTLLPPCIILSANWRTKNGSEASTYKHPTHYSLTFCRGETQPRNMNSQLYTHTWVTLILLYIACYDLYPSVCIRDRFQVGMALAFLLLPFIPASGIVFKVGFVIAER